MPELTPAAQAFVAAQVGQPPWPSMTPAQARAHHLATRRPDPAAPACVWRDERILRGDGAPVPIRVYDETHSSADGAAGSAELPPVLVFAHGGGWVYGDLDMADGFCRRLAVGAGVTVVSVDYGLAPEHPHPDSLEDVYAATAWAAATLAGGAAVGVIGSSAGGNLVIATCLLARERGGPAIGLQVPMCAVTDHGFDRASYTEHGTGKFLTGEDMRWYWAQYLAGGADPSSPLVSVLRADHRGLPPALVVTAEHDPLRDEGEEYGARLAAAGVPVDVRRVEGMIHAFPVLGPFPEEQRAVVTAIGAAVDRWLRP